MQPDQQFTARWLYVKKCSHCELKYFGMTTRKDVDRYQGSGTEWRDHLERHNARAITLNKRFFTQRQHRSCTKAAIAFSERHNIVASKEWANLQIETGDQSTWGAGTPKGARRSERTGLLISTGNLGRAWYHDPKSDFATKLYDNDPLIKARKLVKGMHPNHIARLKKTPEHKQKIGEANKGSNPKKGAWQIGIPKDPLSIAKAVATRKANGVEAWNKGKVYKDVTCPHCGKVGSGHIMKHWHFDKCRHA